VLLSWLVDQKRQVHFTVAKLEKSGHTISKKEIVKKYIKKREKCSCNKTILLNTLKI